MPMVIKLNVPVCVKQNLFSCNQVTKITDGVVLFLEKDFKTERGKVLCDCRNPVAAFIDVSLQTASADKKKSQKEKELELSAA